jgi:hypothetical protein
MYMQIGKSDVMAANVSFRGFCAELAAEIDLKQRRRPSYVPKMTICKEKRNTARVPDESAAKSWCQNSNTLNSETLRRQTAGFREETG